MTRGSDQDDQDRVTTDDERSAHDGGDVHDDDGPSDADRGAASPSHTASTTDALIDAMESADRQSDRATEATRLAARASKFSLITALVAVGVTALPPAIDIIDRVVDAFARQAVAQDYLDALVSDDMDTATSSRNSVVAGSDADWFAYLLVRSRDVEGVAAETAGSATYRWWDGTYELCLPDAGWAEGECLDVEEVDHGAGHRVESFTLDGLALELRIIREDQVSIAPSDENETPLLSDRLGSVLIDSTRFALVDVRLGASSGESVAPLQDEVRYLDEQTGQASTVYEPLLDVCVRSWVQVQTFSQTMSCAFDDQADEPRGTIAVCVDGDAIGWAPERRRCTWVPLV